MVKVTQSIENNLYFLAHKFIWVYTFSFFFVSYLHICMLCICVLTPTELPVAVGCSVSSGLPWWAGCTARESNSCRQTWEWAHPIQGETARHWILQGQSRGTKLWYKSNKEHMICFGSTWAYIWLPKTSYKLNEWVLLIVQTSPLINITPSKHLIDKQDPNNSQSCIV